MNRPSASRHRLTWWKVEKLRKSLSDLLSLAAVESGRIVGHIFFSPVRIDGSEITAYGMGLAPVAVLPSWQRQGIGTLPVQTGAEMLRGQGCPFIIVLGHQEYYPRFGLEMASLHGIRSRWQASRAWGRVWERIR